MNNYKVGDKFEIEIEEVYKSECPWANAVDLYRIKGFNSLVFDKNGLDKLNMNISTTDKVLEAEYNRGRKDQREEILDIINGADDMSQAMYRIIKYLMCEKLQEMEEMEELKNE